MPSLVGSEMCIRDRYSGSPKKRGEKKRKRLDRNSGRTKRERGSIRRNNIHSTIYTERKKEREKSDGEWDAKVIFFPPPAVLVYIEARAAWELYICQLSTYLPGDIFFVTAISPEFAVKDTRERWWKSWSGSGYFGCTIYTRSFHSEAFACWKSSKKAAAAFYPSGISTMRSKLASLVS